MSYTPNKTVGASPGQSQRALVVNIQDPLKAGRVQVRIVGMMDDEQAIPDERLPWVKVRNSTETPSMQTSTVTHGLLPGSMVTLEGMGQGGQDYIITGTIPTDRKDDNQTIHPATQGKEATDNLWEYSGYEEKTHGWDRNIKDIVENKTTRNARKIRDQSGRKAQRKDEPITQARDKSKIPQHYGQRSTSKDPQGGTIGTFKFQGNDAQSFIQQTIQNKSAIVPSALSAIQNLKAVRGNPTSIQSIGLSNYTSIISQLAQWFKSNGGNEEQKKQYDCEWLLDQPDNMLSDKLLEAKQICLILENFVEEIESDV